MAIEDPIVGTNLGDEFDVGVAVPGKITLRVGAGLIRNPDGTLSTDDAYIRTLIGDTGGDTTGDRVTNVGFDPSTEILTLSLADGTQVAGGLPGVVTATELDAKSTPLVDVFGQPIRGYRVLLPG